MSIRMMCLLAGFSCFSGFVMAWGLVMAWEGMPEKWLCDYGETPDRRVSRGENTKKKRRFLLRAAVFALYLLALMWSLIMSGTVRTVHSETVAFWILSTIVIVWVLALIFLSDRTYWIIPDQLVVLLCACGAVRTSALIWLNTHSLTSVPGALLARALAGAACAELFFLLGKGAALLVKLGDGLSVKKMPAKPFDAFGMGDVKLLFAIGILLGFRGGVWVLVLASLACGLCVGILLIAGKLKSRSEHPFGPYLCIATAFLLLAQMRSL